MGSVDVRLGPPPKKKPGLQLDHVRLVVPFPVHLRSEVAMKVKRNVNPLKSDFARAELIEAESIDQALSL